MEDLLCAIHQPNFFPACIGGGSPAG